MDTTVSLARCPNYTPEALSGALDAALTPLGGLDWVQPGMKIAIKANLLSAKRPDTAATTHPALLLALCEKLTARGASVVVGDSPGGPYAAAYVNTVYSVAGVTAVHASGATLNEDFSEQDVAFPNGAVLKQFRCTAYLLQADAIINVSKLKTHGMMAYTGAVKNFFGAIPGFLKFEYHHLYPQHSTFANMLVDICEFFKPTLSITDAVVGMEGNGPSNGTPRQLGFIAAARNPHALDMVCSRIIGLAPSDVPTLLAAQQRELLPKTTGALSLSGNIEDFAVADFKSSPQISIVTFANKLGSSVVRGLFASRPAAQDAACTGCAVCAKLCPAKAIDMQNERPKIHRSACIRCFCCQEFCPTGAMQSRRPLPARLFHK